MVQGGSLGVQVSDEAFCGGGVGICVYKSRRYPCICIYLSHHLFIYLCNRFTRGIWTFIPVSFKMLVVHEGPHSHSRLHLCEALDLYCSGFRALA